MGLKAAVSEGHVQRVLAEVEAGQRTADAQMSDEAIELAGRQIRGEISVDEAVAEIDARARRYARDV